MKNFIYNPHWLWYFGAMRKRLSDSPSYQVFEKEGELFIKVAYRNRFFGIKKGKTSNIALKDAKVIAQLNKGWGWLANAGKITIEIPAQDDPVIIPCVRRPREFMLELGRDMTPIEEVRGSIKLLSKKIFWIVLIVLISLLTGHQIYIGNIEGAFKLSSFVLGIIILYLVYVTARKKRAKHKKANRESRETTENAPVAKTSPLREELAKRRGNKQNKR
jgi:hypothetical protein